MIEIDIQKKLHGSDGTMNLDIKLDIQSGEFMAISGPSGSGKTTLLRILAGLEDAKGYIKVDEDIWLDKSNSLSTQKRGIGFVFQDYALFTNMSVKENLLFVNNDTKLAEHLLELTDLSKLKERMPNKLSGGQKQRVSLCRALMGRPKILLMDEPLSALDPYMRTKLQNDILRLHKEFKITTLMVSHEPSEIYTLADKMIVLNEGKVQKHATPKEILLNTNGTQKFSFRGKILELTKVDVINTAIISIGQQIVEIVISDSEAKDLKVGESVSVSTKAFMPTLTKIS